MNPENSYDGLTDGTQWNGFDNIWITLQSARAIKEIRPELALPVDVNGLINLSGGYATVIKE